MRTAVATIAVLAGCLLPAHAEVYRVEFVVHDPAPAKPVAQRFTLLVDEARAGIFQEGVAVSADPPLDTGSSVECTVHTVGAQVAIAGTLNVSKVVGFIDLGRIRQPIIDHVKLAFHKTVDPGRPSPISEDPKRPVEVTVTRVASAGETPGATAGPVYEVRLEVRQGSGNTAQPSRHYTLRIDPSHKGLFESGDQDSTSSVEVGTKIECAVTGSEGQIHLNGNISLSQIAGTFVTGIHSEPVIAQRKLSFEKAVELGAPVTMASTADLQVEATVGLLRTP